MANESTQDALTAIDVTKVFRLGILKKKTAVQDLNFSVPSGEVIGMLGPNGSGKSTTIKMMMGFLRPTRGEILICGRNAQEQDARDVVGYLPENPRFQKFLTARQLLTYYGKLLSLSGKELRDRVEALLQRVNLKEAGDERIQGFSKGMTQRLAIAQALLNNPKILVFDEPMSGLDPVGRIEIRKLVLEIHHEMPTTTIFFSTHILFDVEQLCSSVILIKGGKLTKHCSISELLEMEGQLFDIVVRDLSQEVKAKLLRNAGARLTPSGISLTVPNVEDLITELKELRAAGGVITAVNSRGKSLEESLFGVIEPEAPKKEANL